MKESQGQKSVSFITECACVDVKCGATTAIFHLWGQKLKMGKWQSTKMEKFWACDDITELQISKPWDCLT